MHAAKDADGNEIKVGDVVGFKSDIEQCGKVVEIRHKYYGWEVVLESFSTFSGEYIGGQTRTTEDADRCWKN